MSQDSDFLRVVDLVLDSYERHIENLFGLSGEITEEHRRTLTQQVLNLPEELYDALVMLANKENSEENS